MNEITEIVAAANALARKHGRKARPLSPNSSDSAVTPSNRVFVATANLSNLC